MSIETTLSDLSTNHATYGITLYAPSTTQQINEFETTLGLTLPDTFRRFYLFCNGFESAEDMFRIIPLEEIAERKQDYEPNSFSIAEYMIYCDMWDVHLTPPDYTNYLISNTDIKYRALTTSFAEFLERFIVGGVFGKGGLYEWHAQVDLQSHS